MLIKSTKNFTANLDFVAPGYDSPPPNPFDLFQLWLDDAINQKVSEPYSFVLSTANNNQPNSRVVLMTAFDQHGIIFGTSDHSEKGKELKANPFVCGNFWWRETIQQIRFQGKINLLSDNISNEMFQARTKQAQAATVVSHPSQPMENEALLKLKAESILEKNKVIKRPESWHGYHITIFSIEFWHGNTNRLHQRLKYTLEQGTWHHCRLQP